MYTFLTVVILITSLSAAAIGLAAATRRTKKTNVIFVVFAFSTSIWILSNFFVLINTNLFTVRLTYAFGAIAMSASLSWILYFSKKDVRLAILSYLLGLVVFGLSLSPLGIKELVSYSITGQKFNYGVLFPVISVWFILTLVIDLAILIQTYRNAIGARKHQTKFVLLGLLATGTTAMTVSFVLPLFGINEFMMLDSPSSLFLVSLSWYAVLKHRLMDLRLLVLKSVAYSLLLALIAGIYIGGVLYIKQGYETFVDPNILFVVSGFLLVLGFQPVRAFIQKYTDKIFAKGRYEPQKLLRKLGEIFSTKVILKDLTKATLETLTQEMRLRRAAFVILSNPELFEVKQIGYKEVSKSSWQKAVSLARDKKEMAVADELEEGSKGKELLRELNTEVLLPLSTEKEMVGLLALGEKTSGDMFTAEDLRFLEVIAPQAATGLEKATSIKERDEVKKKRIAELSSLNKIALSLSSTLDLDQILERVMEEAVRATGAESGSIMLLDKETKTLSVRASRGIQPDISREVRARVGEGIAGWVAEKGETTLITKGGHENGYLESLLKREDITSSLVVPLKTKEKVLGVLSLNRKKKKEAFTPENLNLISSFAAHAAEHIENARLHEKSEDQFMETINSLSEAVDAKDHYTAGHSAAVTRYAVDIAEELGLHPEDIRNIEIAGRLHDIGKIGIPEAILNKPGKLTDEEREVINEHPKTAVKILNGAQSLGEIRPLIHFHHERHDGKGYPAGLAGKDIPVGARILAVADSFNAMRTDRPYRPALSLEDAIKELKENSGTQFDPEVVEAFLRVLEGKKQKLKVGV